MDKKYVYVWYAGKTWARTVDYGVWIDSKKNKIEYHKYNGHYNKENLTLENVTEREKTTLTNLKTFIDDMAKVPNIRSQMMRIAP